VEARRAERDRTPHVERATGPFASMLRVRWVRALRLHQWAKNLLLLLPALAAHLRPSSRLAIQLGLAFLAFSLLASAVYLLNDLVDLPHDRAHSTKRHRPIAAGEISTSAALVGAIVLVVLAIVAASPLPRAFHLMMLLYLATTVSYSLALKRLAIADVLALATLYAMRIVAGAAAAGVPLSQWFLAFSIFLFLSLALVKRVVELQDKPPGDASATPGRGYVASDVPLLAALGQGSAVASALVYCLYITGDDVRRLYSHPELLLAGLPVLLYWISRMWLLTGRKAMHEDPVMFSLRDRVSYLMVGAMLTIVFLAA
jgi:4-hydroxybenzoate polyprenyltransferase